MRPCTFLALLLLATPGQDDSAKKLYDAMEQKITQAKAQKFAFTISADVGGTPVQTRGQLAAAAGNRLQFDYVGNEDNGPERGLLVSDGKTMVLEYRLNDGKPIATSSATDSKLDALLAGYLSRAGVFTLLVDANGWDTNKPRPASAFQLSGFKTIGKEKVGGRDAAVIEFKLVSGPGSTPAVCKLWLDTQTQLPLKRTLQASAAGKVLYRVTETYSAWELDPKLPGDTFALPKE